MKDVEPADETLDRWTPSPTPGDAPGVGARKRDEDALEWKPSQRLANPPRAARTDGSECNDLVPGLGADFGEAATMPRM